MLITLDQLNIPQNQVRRMVLFKGPIRTQQKFRWSASQISSFEGCNRAWFFDKIEKRPRVEKIATYFGGIFHEFRELYLGTGLQGDPKNLDQKLVARVAKEIHEKKIAKLDPWAEAITICQDAANLSNLGLIHLPVRNMFVDKKHIERSIDIQTSVGSIAGYIDFYLPDQGAVNYKPREVKWWDVDGIPLVGDHKSTSNIDYVKTLDELMHEDPQPAIYGMDAVQQTGAAHVDFLWHYNVKKGKKQAVPVRFRMPRSHIEERFAKTEAVAKKMLTIFDSGSIKAADVEPNPKSCDNYGGCPHREYCGLTNQQKLGALTMSDNFQQHLQTQIVQNGQNPNQAPAMANMQNAMAPAGQVVPGFQPPAAAPMQQQQVAGFVQQQPPMQQQQQVVPGFNPPAQAQPELAAPQMQAQPPMQQQAAPPMQTPPPAQVAASLMQTPPPAQVAAPVQQTLAELGAQITPPDAPPPDFDITKEELDAQAKAEKDANKQKKLNKTEKALRDSFALAIYNTLLNQRMSIDPVEAAKDAVYRADKLLAALV